MMENNPIGTFEKYWEQFLTKVKGKMMYHAQRQELTYPLLQLILKEVSYSWDSNVEGNGRWLRQYAQQNPQSGEMIRRILLDDMAFTEISEKKANLDILAQAIPVAGAAAGYGVSSLFGAGPLIKAVSVVAPAVLLYPVAREMGASVKDRDRKEYVDQYMLQLDKYKRSVISILGEAG